MFKVSKLIPVLVASSLLLASPFSMANVQAESQKTAEKLAAQKAFIQTMDQCRSPAKLSSLMNVALKNTDNYQAKAKNAFLFEEIMLNNPACFVQAANQLPQQACKEIKANFIQETFFNPRDQIKQSLARAKGFAASCVAI